MNIYEKLNELKMEMLTAKLKKSGNNKFVGFEYFELQDIMPTIIKKSTELKIASTMSFDKELTTLILFNAENPEEMLVFTMPTSSAALKGCHEVQNLGAVVTYTRRYLWLTALDITEADVLDGSLSKPDKAEKPTENPLVAELQQKALSGYKVLMDIAGSASNANKALKSTKEELAKRFKSTGTEDLQKLIDEINGAVDNG